MLNRRFREGVPTADLERAGVLIHQFDVVDNANPSQGQPWKPSHLRPDVADRISASLIHASMRRDADGIAPVYSHSLSGLVLSPTHNRLLCGFPFDSGTLERTCWPVGGSATCTPGCSVGQRLATWCVAGVDDGDGAGWPCAWAPEDLPALMALRERWRARNYKPKHKAADDHKFYLELVFQAKRYVRELPRSVEAVFYMAGGDCFDAEFDGFKCKDYAREAHDAMLKHFGITSSELPLLTLDLYNETHPFAAAPVRSVQ